MLVLQIFLTLFYLFVSLYLSNKIHRSIIIFFVTCYSLQLILAELNLYQIYAISNQTILIFNCNILFFLIGAILYEYLHNINGRSTNIKLVHEDNVFKDSSFYSVNKLIITQFVFLCVAIYYLKKMSYAALYFNEGESVRAYFFETGGLFSSYTEMFFYQYIIKNYLFIASFIFAYLILLKKRLDVRDIILLILSLLFIGVVAFTSQGRWDVLPPFLMSVFLSFYIKYYYPIIFKRRVFPIIIILSVILFLGISAIGLLRVKLDVSVNNFSSSIYEVILEPFITYFSLPIAAFDYGVRHLFNKESLYYGTATFAGLEELFFTPFLFINKFFNFDIANARLGSLMTPTFYFNSTHGWNALFTGVINYYLDFGYIGIILYPFFIGYTFSKLIVVFLRKNDFFHLMLLAVFFTWMFNNMISSTFQSFSNWILLISFFIYKKFFSLKFKFK